MWKLSSELRGHDTDVRSLALLPTGELVSGSRDRSLRIWSKQDDGSYSSDKQLYAHEDWVSAVTVLPTTGEIVSSARDGSMLKWLDFAPVGVFSGHSANVCCLASTSDGKVVSGSWDKTVRIWDASTQKCEQLLEGHSQAVWAVLPLSGDQGVLTASADKTIRLWKNGQLVRTYSGHEDAVRGLSELAGIGFASVANDGTIRVWTLGGDCVNCIQAHENYVYLIHVTSDGLMLTGSEDKSLKVWKDGECIATLAHPGSVWACVQLGNGDVATGCSDGVIRIWTRDPSRYASEEMQRIYDETIATQAIPKSTLPAGVNVVDPEVLLSPGARDGETKIVRAGEGADAYVWSSAENEWKKIGSVVDSGDDGGKKMLEGKMYDYVVDVNLDDSLPALKLGFNSGDNPYSVAQEFIWKHDLNQDYLSEIAEFLQRQVGGKVIEAVPASSSAAAQQQQQGMKKENVRHLPKTGFLLFDAAKVEPIRAKIEEFGGGVEESVALATDEMEQIKKLIAEACDPKALLTVKQFAGLEKMSKWPRDYAFPYLDLMRLMLLNAGAAKGIAKRTGWGQQNHGNFFQYVVEVGSGDEGNTSVPLRLMALRNIANGFLQASTRPLLGPLCTSVLDELGNSIGFRNAQVQLTYITVLYNYAVMMRVDAAADIDAKTLLIARLMEVFDSGVDLNDDMKYRAVAALGTIVSGNKDLIETARDLGVVDKMHSLASASVSKVQDCAKEIIAMF